MTDEEKTPDIDDSQLADDMALRNSDEHGGRLVAVATKRGVDICWNCFKPLVHGHRDVACGTSLVRVCRESECVQQVYEELNGRPAPGTFRA